MPLQLNRTTKDVLRHLDERLRTGVEPLAVRNHVRGELGPQAFRHAHFAADDFFRPQRATGAVQNVYGQRVLFASGALLSALTETLVERFGPKAVDVLYQAGWQWGEGDFATCMARLEHEYGVPLAALDMALVLESWWWPFRASGWGRWHCDLGRAQVGIVTIEVEQSITAAALGRTGVCECHMYAGLFAGAFCRLTGRTLHGVEFACGARGDDRCRFAVAAPNKIDALRGWRDNGATVAEIQGRLLTLGSS